MSNYLVTFFRVYSLDVSKRLYDSWQRNLEVDVSNKLIKFFTNTDKKLKKGLKVAFKRWKYYVQKDNI